jgi:Xaa-Pro aminopeptidase
VLVVSNAEEASAPRATRLVTYEGFSADRDPPRHEMYVETVISTFRELDLGGVIAVEPTSLSLAVAEAIRPGSTGFVDIRPELVRQRAVKTAAEVEALRTSAHLASVGQMAACEVVVPGKTELEAFGEIRGSIERHAGERVQVVADLLSGADRTADAMGPPGPRQIRDGDAVICDLVPRCAGYWGDSCNTLQVGAPSPEFRKLYATALRAMDTVLDLLKPGITAGQFDQAIRSVSTDAGYEVPIHTGHSIGCANFEYPLLVPEETAVLEPGMVLMVEPGAYAATVGGARLEWMFLVTTHGNEPLSTFSFRREL